MVILLNLGTISKRPMTCLLRLVYCVISNSIFVVLMKIMRYLIVCLCLKNNFLHEKSCSDEVKLNFTLITGAFSLKLIYIFNHSLFKASLLSTIKVNISKVKDKTKFYFANARRYWHGVNEKNIT